MNKKNILPISYPIEGAAGKTGSWRTEKPVYDPSLCNECMLCWLYCPEAAITRDDRNINYDYCKGCGICAEVCAKKAIWMVKEEIK